MFGESFIKRASAWYLDGTVIKPRTPGTSLEYDGAVDITGQLQGDLINNQMVSKATFDILGLMTDPRCLYMQNKDPGAGTLYDESGQGHDGTYQGSMTTGDRVERGMGWAIDFDGTDDYVNLGDDDDLSVGNGANDEAVTWFGAVEVIDVATNQNIIAKYDNTSSSELREWRVYLNTDEKLLIVQYDESANVAVYSATDNPISVGWHTYVITSPGDGGATAMNNVKLYIDGAIVASTPSNNASYVAMENLASPCWIGANEGSGGVPESLMTGDNALIGMDGSEWSAYDVHRFHELAKGLYGL